MATKYKLELDSASQQAIYFNNSIPKLPDSDDWEVELIIEYQGGAANNAIFSKFKDGSANYSPYSLLMANGTIKEVSSGGSETIQGGGYDTAGLITLTMSHVANNSNLVTYNLNGVVSTEASTNAEFQDFNYLFGLVRNLAGQNSFYFSAEFYSLKITSPSFNETWDANLIGTSGAVTTLPSLSGTRDATLPNGATSVAYDDGTGGGANTKPVAVIGADASINTGATYTADLNGSYDDDADDTLSYSTTLTVPAGSSAALSGETTTSPSFTPDIDGAYRLTAKVNDGTVDSDEVTQTLTATTPSSSISDAGSDSVQYTGANVTLNGSASVGSLFSWSILQAPPSSTATITSSTSQSASITLIEIGLYEFQLDVDGELSSVFVRVRAVIQPKTPIASIKLSGTEELGRTVTLIAEGKYNA